MGNPKYAAEVKEIQTMEKALAKKIDQDLVWDDEGFEMWKVHMDNEKDYEIIRERKEQAKDIDAFIAKHKMVQMNLNKLGEEVHESLEEIGEELMEFSKYIEDNHKEEFLAWNANCTKIDHHMQRGIKVDDEGWKMWTVSWENEHFKENMKMREA